MEATRTSIDFGTSHTVAMLSVPGREPRPLLFDGSPLLPSAVYAHPDGRLVVGRDAWHAGSANPAGLEPHPKRHIDGGVGWTEFFENGRSRGRQALAFDPKPSTYLCDGDTFTEYTEDWRVDYRRRH